MTHAYRPLQDPPSTPSSTDTLVERCRDVGRDVGTPCGSHRVKYRGAGPLSPHDFVLETSRQNVDVSLVLPHFRARNQPLDHRLSMLVANSGQDPIKVKVCRNFTTARSTRFHLEVHSESTADITVWLPSDFKGHIHRSANSKRVRFSSGFTNRIMHNVQLTQSRRPSLVPELASPDGEPYSDIYISHAESCHDEDKWYGGIVEEDEVVVHTAGHVTFRMWDIDRGEPEVRAKEACKRMFGFGWCTKRTAEVTIDWDFLIEDL